VARIGKQRQGAGQHAADDLGHHERAGKAGRDADAALVGRVAVVRVIVLVIVVGVCVRVGMWHLSIRSRPNTSTRD